MFGREAPLVREGDCGEQIAGMVSVCTRYAAATVRAMPNRPAKSGALLFAIFHEAAHQFDWAERTGPDDERAADEMAAALMIIINGKDRLQAAAKASVQLNSRSRRVQNLRKLNPHYPDRRRWLYVMAAIEAPAFMPRWQEIMQRRFSRQFKSRLCRKPPAWLDVQLFGKSLSKAQRRKCTALNTLR